MPQGSISDPTFRNSRGAVVGSLSGDGYLEKHLDYDKHHLRVFHGWATETHHLSQLEEVGGKGFRLILKDGRILESALQLWERHGYQPRGLDGPQTVLSDKYWTEKVPGVEQLTLGV